MKRFKLIATQCLLVVAMLAPWASIEAREFFDESATITKRNSLNFETEDGLYRISSQMKMLSDDSRKQRYSDLRPGDIIYFKGEIINEQYYVREIHYWTPVES